jgi:hypothetical protein
LLAGAGNIAQFKGVEFGIDVLFQLPDAFHHRGHGLFHVGLVHAAGGGVFPLLLDKFAQGGYGLG